jgi:hypothetical protein
MKKNPRMTAWLGGIALSLMLAACNLPQPSMMGIGQKSPVPPTPFQPSGPGNTITLALTPAATTQASSALCVAPQAHAALNLVPFKDLPASIGAFLNAGGLPGELETDLGSAALGTPPNPVLTGDVDGDGKTDVAISLTNLASSIAPTPGELLVFTCQKGMYQLSYTQESPQDYGAPAIQSVEDLNGDSKAEIVAGMQTCGAHTCYTDVKVLAWIEGGFQNRLEGTTTDIPYPRVQINPVTEGGIADIVIQGGEIASAGAGPQRIETRTWAFDQESGSWKVATDEQAPSTYRIHLLQDADATLHKGDPAQALVVYTWVLSDQPPLQDYQDPAAEKLNLGAYAAYKIVVIHLDAGENDAAQQMLDQMAKDYKEGSPQRAYYEMAQAYQQALADGGDKAKACSAVSDYALAHTAQVLAPLGPQAFGYANKEFAPQDMCP